MALTLQIPILTLNLHLNRPDVNPASDVIPERDGNMSYNDAKQVLMLNLGPVRRAENISFTAHSNPATAGDYDDDDDETDDGVFGAREIQDESLDTSVIKDRLAQMVPPPFAGKLRPVRIRDYATGEDRDETLNRRLLPLLTIQNALFRSFYEGALKRVYVLLRGQLHECSCAFSEEKTHIVFSCVMRQHDAAEACIFSAG